ncbi:Potassium channel [Onygenales sp. PD_10]|nr:Potassium channel [Onygenales sp. PD_10]
MDAETSAADPPSSNREVDGYERNPSDAGFPSSATLGTREVPLETRWWFASTAFPLLAGTFGPTASAFSICSLAQEWRAEIPPGKSQDDAYFVEDPKWLAIAINSVSLAFALISNFSLLLNMARRLSFPIAQPITIGGWYISSILLVCLAALLRHSSNMTNRVMTQAYYYAIIAAALYFLISSLMVITVIGARRHHYSREFRLTTNQRSLMLQTIIWIVYLLGGAAIYAHLEDWNYLDAVYWADITLLTDGFGDFAPKTHTGRGLLFPYAVGGILTLALVVSSIRDLMLERGKKAIIARRTELARRRIAKKVRTGKGGVPWIKLPPISDPVLLSEAQRQEEEFYLMRKIHEITSLKLKWVMLAIAVTAWLGLWTLGALAFFLSQRQQGWTYFESLYFAYTSLLTIGYGDFVPKMTWGKPFFVFWSLLAIPTMTILISSMGGTIAKFLDDATNYAGELTVLPGDMSFKDRMMSPVHKLKSWTSSTSRDLIVHTLSFRSQNEDTTISYLGPRGRREQQELEHREKHIKKAAQNPRHRQHLLIREIRKLYGDLGSTPPRKYSYDEWHYYLSLVGRAESCSSYINVPVAQLDEPQGPQIGLEPSITAEELKGKARKWSWIGPRSPLMGDQDEAQWLFEALSSTLEHELTIQSEENTSEARNGRAQPS